MARFDTIRSRRAHRRHRAAVVLTALAATSAAHANPEFQVFYDARSTAMGGTGMSHSTSGATVAMNPAGLMALGDASVTAAFTPFLLQPSVPFAGPGSERDGERETVPLFLVAGGARVHERVAVGAGVYASSGVGATYRGVPELGGADLSLQVAMIEFALPVAFAVSPSLDVGASLRFNYARQDTDQPVPVGPGMFGRMKQDLSGLDMVPAITLGARFRPSASSQLAFVYRSKATAEYDGTTTLATPAGELSDGTDTAWSMPHVLQLGGSYALLERKLLLAGEVAVSFYGESNESQVQTFATGFQNTAPRESTVEFNWGHTVQLKTGAELMVTPSLALRLGYSAGNSATPEKGANPFAPPPGLMQAVTTGAGLRVSHMEMDLGGGILFAGSDVDSADMGSPGHYGASAWILAIAATYRQ